MIPEERLSTTPVYATPEVNPPQDGALISFQLGGTALNNPNDGLEVKVWTCLVIPGDPNDSITVEAADVPPVVVTTAPEITQVSLAFDQNMQPAIAYVSVGNAYLYWYDTAVGDYVVTNFGPTFRSPRVTLDDHRDLELSTSDIILGYIRDGNLYYRQQRDRYLIERILYPDINTVIVNPYLNYICMNDEGRLQFEIRGYFFGG